RSRGRPDRGAQVVQPRRSRGPRGSGVVPRRRVRRDDRARDRRSPAPRAPVAGRGSAPGRLSLSKRGSFAEKELILRDAGAFALEEFGNGRPETGVGDEMHRSGLDGFVAARELVAALRARLDAGKAAFDGRVDGLVIAQLEMQEGLVFEAAPIAAV